MEELWEATHFWKNQGVCEVEPQSNNTEGFLSIDLNCIQWPANERYQHQRKSIEKQKWVESTDGNCGGYPIHIYRGYLIGSTDQIHIDACIIVWGSFPDKSKYKVASESYALWLHTYATLSTGIPKRCMHYLKTSRTHVKFITQTFMAEEVENGLQWWHGNATIGFTSMPPMTRRKLGRKEKSWRRYASKGKNTEWIFSTQLRWRAIHPRICKSIL